MMPDFTRGVPRALALPILRWYWRVFKPKTYGVKVIIQHPDSKKILVVRHSYGDQAIWSLPGGGYRPKRESLQAAAKREIKEELGLELTGLQKLGEYKTTAQGKRDTVAIFQAQVIDSTITTNFEIEEYQWIEPDKFASMTPIYKISKYAMNLLEGTVD